MAQKGNNKSKKNKNIGFAWALWGLVAIVILLVFLAKKDTIVSNLKTTGFFDRVFGSTPEFVEKHEVVEKEEKPSKKKNDQQKLDDVIVVDVMPEKTESLVLKEKDAVVQKPEDAKVSTDNNSNKVEKIEKVENKVEEKKEPVKEEKPVEKKKIDLNLCFVIIDSEGGVSRREIKRSVVKSDSPLTSAINLLLAGPLVSNSAERDCITLIPEGTRLLSAKVQNGVAYLNFSEEFEFNSYGVEGYKHQLEQIVFTATSFSTVKSVQFLIEGVQEQYLGSEGMWIGSPLSRSSF